MSGIYRALLLKHLRNYNDPHQTKIIEVKEELAVEEKTVILTNTLAYPLNNSIQTIILDNPKTTLDYWVETEVLESDGNIGGIIISNKRLNEFKLGFTGNATNAIIKCWIRGGGILNLPPIGTSLDDCTWKQISDISRAGLAADYFSVGDCKAVHLQGTIGVLDINETYYDFILGFDHNSEIEGQGISFGAFKTAKTGGIDVTLVGNYGLNSLDGTKYFSMNHSSLGNLGGWQGCDLRYDVLGSVGAKNTQNASLATILSPVPNTLLAALPADLRVVMKPITKYTDNYGDANNNDPTKVTTTIDYLPLLSEFEVFGARTNANSSEQTYQEQYEYYRAGNSKNKKKSEELTTSGAWWLRSTPYEFNNRFCMVDSSGRTFYNGSNNSFGLSPVFLV